MTRPRIAVLPGDEPGVVACARRALEAVAELEVIELPSADAPVVRDFDAVLAARPLPALSRALDHRAGLLAVRPARVLMAASPLREERIARTDLLIVRGLGPAVEGVARRAFDAAERRLGRLACVHRADADEASRLWRATVDRLAGEHPDVDVAHVLDVDAGPELVASPSRLDVLACESRLGNAFAGVAAAITGLAAMLPCASLGEGTPGVFAPFPSAGARPGAGSTANPLPAVLAAALLLREGLGMEPEAERLEVAVDLALDTGLRTPDLLLGAPGERRAGTEALSAAVLSGVGVPG